MARLTMAEQQQRNHGMSAAFAPTLRDVLAVGFRHQRLIGLSFAVIFLGSILSVLLVPKEYQAHMKFLVRQERANPMVTPGPSNTVSPANTEMTEEQLNSEAELIKSRDLLEKAVVTCGLDQHRPESRLTARLSHWLTSGSAENRSQAAEKQAAVAEAVRRLESKLQVEPVKKTNLISVSYVNPDPAVAARVLQTLAGLYLEKHVEVHRDPGVVGFFHEQAENYKAGLRTAEAKLADFSQNGGAVAPEIEKQHVLDQLTQFQSILEQTGAGIAETEKRIRSLESLAAGTPARETTQVRTSDNGTLMQQLKSTLLTLELKRTDLLMKFNPDYPPLQEVDKEITETRAAIEAAEKSPLRDETTDRDPTYEWLRSELARTKTELVALQARAAATSETVRALRERARRLDQQGIVQQDLVRAAKEAEANYTLYLQKEEEARISDALDRNRIVNVAMAEAPTVPTLPTRPRLLWTVLLGAVLASVVSLGLAFVSDYLDPTFRSAEEVQAILSIPVLAAIPKSNK